MNTFVFRNNTVEPFFPKDYTFSGYEDISVIPSDIQTCVWFYQIPIRFNQETLATEIRSYIQNFEFVLSQLAPTVNCIAITLDVVYSVLFTDDNHSLSEAIAEYNHALFTAAERHPQVKVIDISEFYRQYSVNELFDWKFYFVSQLGLNPKLAKSFQAWWAKKLENIALKRKKCLVLDLDNTLWGGILGEDGIDGIQIGNDYPGKAFLYFQNALQELSKTGVILTICSKNNEQDVLDLWRSNPFLLLTKKDFAAYRINWKDKASNIIELAEELNIGLDSMVFIDDNPTERALVRAALPMVAVPEFPLQPYMLPVFFKQLVESYFSVYTITSEDLKKTEQYKANALRATAAACFSNLTEFIQSLDIHITIEEANDFNIQRIAQMTQKTNQFNLTTRRYTEADVRRFLEMGWIIRCISVSDKFGDNGITGVIMITPEAEIDTFLLSCRILGKGIEVAFIKQMLVLLNEKGASQLHASYIPTAKNAQTKDFYERCGFTCNNENSQGVKTYSINIETADKQIDKAYRIFVK